MAEQVQTPPTTPAPVATPAPVHPLAPVVPKPISPDDDPNYHIQKLIEKKAEKKASEEAKKTEQKPVEPAKPADTVPPENKNLGDLVSKALGFRSKPVEKPAEPAKTPEPAKVQEPAKPAETPAPVKTIVGKKKQPTPATDPVAIATAAATAALKAQAQPAPRPDPVRQDPSELLKDVDQHELAVAKYLGETNPKYKGADKLILEHIKKAESYAARWEQQNPGKSFNPEDEEHNDFYTSLEKPWSDHEFRMAEAEMAAERIVERRSKGSQAKITELEQEHAVVELKPIVTQTFHAAASALASGVGEEVLKEITTSGFDKFAEKDPVAAGEIGLALESIRPLIDTIIQLDEPKGRIKYNEKNQQHQQWARLLLEKEAQYVGSQDESGNTYVSRQDWARMSDADRYKKAYLTADHLVAEVVADAVESTKVRIQKERDRIKKAAIAMGFAEPGSTPVTKKQDPEPAKTPEAPAKPVSPSDEGSPRMDTPGGGPKTPVEKALAATSSVLFRR